MSEENGSAEEQAGRMNERATESKGQWQPHEGEGYEMTGSEGSMGAIRRFGRRVAANPAGPLIVGLALIAGSAAAIVVQKQRSRPLGLLRIRARAAAEALREGDFAVGPRVFGILARVAALGLAGVAWRKMRSLAHGRVE